MMDGEGYAGHSTGINALFGKVGLECEWARTRKSHENRYLYFNPQVKLRISAKEGSEVSKYSYLTGGFYHFQAIKNSTFTGRGENLRYPHWDTLEGALTFNTYDVFTKQKSSFFQLGFESVAEKHLDVQGFVYYINPINWVILAVSEGDVEEIDYTRTIRFSLFAAPPGWLTLGQTGTSMRSSGYVPPNYPAENVILDPVGKNMIGARLALQWTTLKVGSSFGLEMTLIPGQFSIPGVYGRNFPDDNIFIKANFGIAIGTSENN